MNQLAAAIAIVLFPGVIASVICDKLIVHYQRWDAFKYGVYSFVFGLLSYAALQGVVVLLHDVDRYMPGIATVQGPGLSAWSVVAEEKYRINLLEVLWATFLAPAVAILAALIVNFKLINRLARKVGISNKYGDENLYSYYLNAKGVEWIYVRDKEAGLSYFGRLNSFAEYSGTHELVLDQVEVFEYDTSTFLYKVGSIYLAKPVGRFVIEVPELSNDEETNGQQADSGIDDSGNVKKPE